MGKGEVPGRELVDGGVRGLVDHGAGGHRQAKRW